MSDLTLSQPGGGDIAPLSYISWKISCTPWATDLKLSDNSNDVIFKTGFKFQPPRPTLGYRSNAQTPKDPQNGF